VHDDELIVELQQGQHRTRGQLGNRLLPFRRVVALGRVDGVAADGDDQSARNLVRVVHGCSSPRICALLKDNDYDHDGAYL
jgi:hypothetical protein